MHGGRIFSALSAGLLYTTVDVPIDLLSNEVQHRSDGRTLAGKLGCHHVHAGVVFSQDRRHGSCRSRVRTNKHAHYE